MRECPKCGSAVIVRRVPSVGLRTVCKVCSWHGPPPFYEEQRDAGQTSLLEDDDDDESDHGLSGAD
jgi:hypothetical protein